MFKARKDITKIFAGRRKEITYRGPVPKLFDMCIQVLQNNIESKHKNWDRDLTPFLRRGIGFLWRSRVETFGRGNQTLLFREYTIWGWDE